MSIALAFLMAWSAFTGWVIFLGGAETIEGTFAARLLSPFSARRPNARRIKALVGSAWFVYISLFVLWVSLI